MENKEMVTGIVVGVLGLGIGFAVGYQTSKKKFERFANEEIASVKETYSRRYKDGVYATPESASAVLIPEDEDETDIRPTRPFPSGRLLRFPTSPTSLPKRNI